MAAQMIRWLDELDPQDVKAAGRPAVRLAVLRRHGFQTHAGFVITTHAYRRAGDQMHLSEVIRRAVSRRAIRSLSEASLKIRERILGGPMPPDVSEPVKDAVRTLLQRSDFGGQLLAVPSLVHEDLEPGEPDDLDILYQAVESPAEMLLVMRKCWAACWRERSLHNHLRGGHSWMNQDVAVLVVEARRSSRWLRVYGLNPYSGSRRERVSEAVGDELELVNSRSVRGSLGRFTPDGRLLSRVPAPCQTDEGPPEEELAGLVGQCSQAQKILGTSLRLDFSYPAASGPGSEEQPSLLRVQAVTVKERRQRPAPDILEAADRMNEYLPQPPLTVERSGFGAQLGFAVRRRLNAAGVAMEGDDSWWHEGDFSLTCRLPRVGGGWQYPLLPLRLLLGSPLDRDLAESLSRKAAERVKAAARLKERLAGGEDVGRGLAEMVEEIWSLLTRTAGELAAADRWARYVLARQEGRGSGGFTLIPPELIGPVGPAEPSRQPGRRQEVPAVADDSSQTSARLHQLWWLSVWVEDLCGRALNQLQQAGRSCLGIMGRMMHADGRLYMPEDAYFLEWDELCELWSGGRELTPLQVELIARHRDAWVRAAMVSPWHRFGIHEGQLEQMWTGWPVEQVQGSGAAPGQGRGPVVNLNTAADAAEANVFTESVWVLPRTEPSLVQAVLADGGQPAAIIVETHGRLSQLVRLAHRYPVPIVTGLRDASRRLAPGEVLVVRGRQGTVQRVMEQEQTRAGWGGS